MLHHSQLWRALMLGMPLDAGEQLPWAKSMPEGPSKERCFQVCRSYFYGYMAAMMDDSDAGVRRTLETLHPEMRGFAYEGIAMAVIVRDVARPRRGAERLAELAHARQRALEVFAYVGAGVACGQLRRRPGYLLETIDPVLGWYVFDGFGFWHALLQSERVYGNNYERSGLSDIELHYYRHGVGRATWFVSGMNPQQTIRRVLAMPEERRASVWTGIGVASTYAEGTDAAGLNDLLSGAGKYAPQLCVGAAGACYIRMFAGNPSPHTETAASVYLGQDVSNVARWFQAELEVARTLGPNPEAAARRFMDGVRIHVHAAIEDRARSQTPSVAAAQ